ncbi:MAG: MFS transporter [Candidatus Hodarchaeota archaeon]
MNDTVKEESIPVKEGTNGDVKTKSNKSGVSPYLPLLAIQPLSFWMIWMMINIIALSEILWPGQEFAGDKIGLIYGIGVIVMSVSKFIYGPIVDRYNRKKIIIIHSSLSAVVIFLHGFIPTNMVEDGVDYTFLYLLILTIIIGALKGGLCEVNGPAINSIVDDAVDEEKKSQVFGMITIISQIGFILCPVISSLTFTINWQWYFWITSIIIELPVIWIAIKAREPKRGAKKAELKSLLKLGNMVYKYQLTRETIKSTLFSRTNIFAFLEGIFTQAILAVPWFLIYAFIQSPPMNFSPFSQSMFMLIFGLPGNMIGATVLAKKSDQLGKKNIKNRIFFIFGSLMLYYLMWILFVYIPYTPLTSQQGANIGAILSTPIYWLSGAVFVVAGILAPLFMLNQRPLLQKINLPEAQGLVTGANTFLEQLGRGIGMIIAGSLLVFFNRYYQLTVLVLVLIGMIGGAMWLLNLKWIDKDVARVSDILKERAKELEKK